MLLAIGGGVLLLMLLGAGAMMFLRKRKKSGADPALPKSIADGADGHDPNELDPSSELAKKLLEQEKSDLAAFASLKASTIATKKGDMLTREIIETTKRDPAVSAHVLQAWLHEND